MKRNLSCASADHPCSGNRANDTYDRLKRSLRAEIAESLPFDLPVTGKIAVKVINDYGDEVLQVFPVK